MLSYDTLVHQATRTTEEYHEAAIAYLDEKFGEGYSKAHPEAIATYVKTCATDFATMVFVNETEHLFEAIIAHLRGW